MAIRSTHLPDLELHEDPPMQPGPFPQEGPPDDQSDKAERELDRQAQAGLEKKRSEHERRSKYESHIDYLSLLNIFVVQLFALIAGVKLRFLGSWLATGVNQLFFLAVGYILYQAATGFLEFRLIAKMVNGRVGLQTIVANLGNKLFYLLEVAVFFIMENALGPNTFSVGLFMMIIHFISILGLVYYSNGRKSKKLVVQTHPENKHLQLCCGCAAHGSVDCERKKVGTEIVSCSDVDFSRLQHLAVDSLSLHHLLRVQAVQEEVRAQAVRFQRGAVCGVRKVDAGK